LGSSRGSEENVPFEGHEGTVGKPHRRSFVTSFRFH
jgi:hypothetical protein